MGSTFPNFRAITEGSEEFLDTLTAIKGPAYAKGVAMLCNIVHLCVFDPILQGVLNSAVFYVQESSSPQYARDMLKDAETLFNIQKNLRNSPQ